MRLKQRSLFCVFFLAAVAFTSLSLEQSSGAESLRTAQLAATKSRPPVNRSSEMQPAVSDDAADAGTPMVWDTAEKRSIADPAISVGIISGVLLALITVEISRQRKNRKAGAET